MWCPNVSSLPGASWRGTGRSSVSVMSSISISISTKESCVDFRRSSPAPLCSVVHGQSVDLVTHYKYHGATFENKLKFDRNCELLCKNGQQRLFCLRKFTKFQVGKTLIKMFYSAFIESIITFSTICWYGNLSNKDKNSLGWIIKLASKTVGVNFNSLDQTYKKQVLEKAICTDDSHPLSSEYKLLPSGLCLTAL